MQTNILIATRTYHDWDAETLIEYELQDRMYRKPCGSFVLMLAGNKPSDPARAEAYGLDGVFAWLRELPEQIVRNVIEQC
jgi:hypothetical protein